MNQGWQRFIPSAGLLALVTGIMIFKIQVNIPHTVQ